MMKTATLKMLRELLRQCETFEPKIDDAATAASDAYDSKSERWQESEKGEAARTDVEQLQSVKDALETLKGELENVDGITE